MLKRARKKLQRVKMIMKNNVQILPIIASIGIGAAAYSMMTGRSGQLQNMMPQLSNLNTQNENSKNPPSQTGPTSQ